MFVGGQRNKNWALGVTGFPFGFIAYGQCKPLIIDWFFCFDNHPNNNSFETFGFKRGSFFSTDQSLTANFGPM